MVEADDLETRKAALASIDAEIAERIQRFEDSIAGLRGEHDRLRCEYVDSLRAELARVDATASTAPLGRILAAIERGHEPVIVRRLRELAARRTGARLE